MSDELNLSDMNWCKKEIDSLRQQLATANMAEEMTRRDCLNLTEKVIPNIKQGYVKQLADSQKREAEALAACKLKDAVLWETNKYLDQTYADLIGNYGSEWLAARIVDNLSPNLSKAIAIQPDDAALRTWLGEPVATIRVESFNTVRWLVDSLPNGSKLYSPKELK